MTANDEADSKMSRCSEGWSELVRQYPDDPRLTSETIFALPKRLTDCLHRTASQVVGVDDLAFEHRLRELSSTGFFHGFPMFSEVLDGLVEDEREFSLDSMPKAAKTRRDTLLAILDEFGSQDQTAAGLRASRSKRNELSVRIQKRLKGYTGWLVLQPQFRADVAVTLARHSNVIESAETTCGSGIHPVEGAQLAYLGAKTSLCRHWGLDAMTGNSIPDPMWPRFWREPIARDDLSDELGASIFIPWPMLVDKDLRIQEVIDVQRARRNLDYLEAWISGKKKWGVTRLSRLLDLFVYGELALSRRYGGRVRGHQEQIDEAFATYWQREEQRQNSDGALHQAESARKTRLHLQRELQTVESAIRKAIELYAVTGQRPSRNGFTRFDEDSPRNHSAT